MGSSIEARNKPAVEENEYCCRESSAKACLLISWKRSKQRLSSFSGIFLTATSLDDPSYRFALDQRWGNTQAHLQHILNTYRFALDQRWGNTQTHLQHNTSTLSAHDKHNLIAKCRSVKRPYFHIAEIIDSDVAIEISNGKVPGVGRYGDEMWYGASTCNNQSQAEFTKLTHAKQLIS